MKLGMLLLKMGVFKKFTIPAKRRFLLKRYASLLEEATVPMDLDSHGKYCSWLTSYLHQKNTDKIRTNFLSPFGAVDILIDDDLVIDVNFSTEDTEVIPLVERCESLSKVWTVMPVFFHTEKHIENVIESRLSKARPRVAKITSFIMRYDY